MFIDFIERKGKERVTEKESDCASDFLSLARSSAGKKKLVKEVSHSLNLLTVIRKLNKNFLSKCFVF